MPLFGFENRGVTKTVPELPPTWGVTIATPGTMCCEFGGWIAEGSARRGLPCAQRGAQPYIF
ncbi:hypothetical protein A2U01_0071454, partial [Trifolium medium]|nr:hypothetical protein [Trifolium medium]